MADAKKFRLIPYRDTAGRIAVEQSAEDYTIDGYGKLSLGGTPRVRSGYWYDMEEAGGSAYNGSNEITFASGSNRYGFPATVVIPITVPKSQVWSIYGIADYTANPSLQAFEINQLDVGYPLIYLSPDLYTNDDHKAILNGPFPPVGEGRKLSITLYGTSSTTDEIDILFKIAEPSAQD